MSSSSAAETNPSPHRFTNRLIHEKSPYLLQHAHNPVDWYPWGPEAFEAARAQDRPIFLSVGYSACHWCHVMERESFENEEIAALINRHFVSIKVDREERPDVDEVYMTATQMMTQHGGWPMSVFMTPDGRPFFTGTYFPPESRHGRAGFPQVIEQLAQAWRERRDEVEEVASHVAHSLQDSTRIRIEGAQASGPIDAAALLRGAVAQMEESFDERNGGFGAAPKFPPHHSLRLLCEAVRRGDTHDAPRFLTVTLDKMALGGVYDHIGGGFHRYSTDAVWLLPHFEKMLYDNALLARVYADAYALTGREAYARVARETCNWVMRDMTEENGGFFAALDADSEGEEGKFYVWTQTEVKEILGDELGDAFCAAYNIQPNGNFREEATGHPTGTNIPHLATGSPPVELPDALSPQMQAARATLLARRYERVPPGLDDKVITAWNGLMIGALAYAGKALDEPRYLDAARRAAYFCLTTLRPDGQLLRRYAKGEAALPAYLDDHAFLADGLLDLYDATGETRWADAARSLADTLLTHFRDEEDGGFFFTGKAHEQLIAQSKELFDGALPSGNGVAARVLARLGSLPGGDEYAEQARTMLRAFHELMRRAPQGTQSLIVASLKAFEDSGRDGDAAGGVPAPSDIATLTVEGPSPLAVGPGQTASATFTLSLAQGYHVYARQPGLAHLIPTVAAITSDAPAAVGPVGYPESVLWESAGERLPVYQGTAGFIVPIAIAEDAAPGRYTLALTVRFQACSETECLPPDERSALLEIDVKDE